MHKGGFGAARAGRWRSLICLTTLGPKPAQQVGREARIDGQGCSFQAVLERRDGTRREEGCAGVEHDNVPP